MPRGGGVPAGISSRWRSLKKLSGQMPNCEYRAYLENEVVAEAKRLAAIRA